MNDFDDYEELMFDQNDEDFVELNRQINDNGVIKTENY